MLELLEKRRRLGNDWRPVNSVGGATKARTASAAEAMEEVPLLLGDRHCVDIGGAIRWSRDPSDPRRRFSVSKSSSRAPICARRSRF